MVEVVLQPYLYFLHLHGTADVEDGDGEVVVEGYSLVGEGLSLLDLSECVKFGYAAHLVGWVVVADDNLLLCYHLRTELAVVRLTA